MSAIPLPSLAVCKDVGGGSSVSVFSLTCCSFPHPPLYILRFANAHSFSMIFSYMLLFLSLAPLPSLFKISRLTVDASSLPPLNILSPLPSFYL